MRLVGEARVGFPQRKVHGVEDCATNEHENADGNAPDVSHPPTPNSQHAGHDRRSDAYHPKDLHPKVFLNETPFQPLRTQMDLVVFNRLDVLGCDA